MLLNTPLCDLYPDLLLIKSPIVRHLDCFQFFCIINITSMSRPKTRLNSHSELCPLDTVLIMEAYFEEQIFEDF